MYFFIKIHISTVHDLYLIYIHYYINFLVASSTREFRSSLIRFHGVPLKDYLKDYRKNPVQAIQSFQGFFVKEIDNQLHRNSSLNYKIIYILPRYGEDDVVLVRFKSADEAGWYRL